MEPATQRRSAARPIAAALVLAACGATADTPHDPGLVAPRDDGLRARIAAAVAERDAGTPRFTNRLVLESSPYLLQHAHNPVDWYPWGEEAFEAARRLGRPIFLSIGYSTCHWCHVMEEESFEDLEIAAALNRWFVPVKVDREERPDLDALYMAAVQSLTGRGGWPMSTWLTPGGEPFHGGTYFPPRDGDRGRAVGFLTVLTRIHEAWREEPDRVRASAARLAATVRRRVGGPAAAATGGLPGPATIDRAIERYRERFDARHGGQRGAPKFPSSFPVRLLLREAARRGDDGLRAMAIDTLDAMAAGGIRDQLGGSFHRYAVDAAWLVPHFEKTLYDNARLALAYLEASRLTGEPRFADVAREVLDGVYVELTAPGGGFIAATDADSVGPDGEREEGLYFTWTPAELRSALGETRGRRIAAVYGVSERGDLDGRSVLARRRPLAEIATELGIEEAELRGDLARQRRRLRNLRLRRPRPARDEKIIAAWNGMMIETMARAGFALERPLFTALAELSARVVLDRLVVDGRLHRSLTGERVGPRGFLDDHAAMIGGLLALFETGGDPAHLEAALRLQAELDRRFAAEPGGYFMTADDHEALLARERPDRDGAEPSGNSLALANLLRLHQLTGDDAWRARADRLLTAFAPPLERAPTSLSEMLLALRLRHDPPRQVVLVAGTTGDGPGPFLDVLRERTGSGEVVVRVRGAGERPRLEALAPIVRGKLARDGRPTAYVCRDGICRLPTTDPHELRRQLESDPGGRDQDGLRSPRKKQAQSTSND